MSSATITSSPPTPDRAGVPPLGAPPPQPDGPTLAFSANGPHPVVLASAAERHFYPSKLTIPPLGPGAVARERLLGRLDAGLASGAALSVVVAPAGWGKTTLLAAWAVRLVTAGQGVAWVALEARDADPNRFWSAVVAALERVAPGIGAGVVPLLRRPEPLPEAAVAALLSAIGTVAGDLAARRAATPEAGAIVLILDDLHAVDCAQTQAGLAELVRHVARPGGAAGFHLVLASRADPAIPLGRLRASGSLTELRAPDLRFDAAEAAAFLSGTMLLDLPPERIAALTDQTEGWAAGLRLAALSLKPPAATHRDGSPSSSPASRGPVVPSPSPASPSFTGSNRAVADYLLEEVLGCQSGADREFLLRTAILDRLTGPLCDVLTEGPEARRRGDGETTRTNDADGFGTERQGEAGWETLERLERAGLFLMPLDAERRWFRYHRLFADYLRDRLRRERPAEVTGLYRHAAAWHERAGMLVEAVDLLMTAPDYPAAATLIARVGPSVLWSCGEVATVRRWLDTLPDAIVRADPRLCLAHAWALTLSGDAPAAEARLADAESAVGRRTSEGRPGATGGTQRDATSSSVVPPAVRLPTANPYVGEIAAVRGRLAALAGDLAGTVRYAGEALAALPPDDPLRPDVALNLGFAALGEGDMAGAERAYAESERAGRRAGNERTTLLAVRYRAALELAHGRLRRATQILREALAELSDRLDGAPLPPAAGLLHVGLGEILYEQNDLAAAEEHLRIGLALGHRGGDVKILLPGHVALAHLEQTWGQTGRAAETMAVASRLMPSPFLAAATARLALARGDVATAERWAREAGPPRDTPACNAREFELATLARLEITRGDHAAADRLADDLKASAERDGRVGGIAEALVLRALIADARGGSDDPERAADALADALTIVAPEGARRVFLDEGFPLVALLTALRAAERRGSARLAPEARAHLDLILADAGPPSNSRAVAPPSGTSLSPRLDASIPPLLDSLTPRELEILNLIDTGLSNREIAERLFVTIGTVKTHTHRAYAKLDVTGRTQALARARGLGLLGG